MLKVLILIFDIIFLPSLYFPFLLFLQNLYVLFAHICACNLCHCVEDFHFEIKPDVEIFPVFRVKRTVSSSNSFLTTVSASSKQVELPCGLAFEDWCDTSNWQQVENSIVGSWLFQYLLCISFQVFCSLFFHYVSCHAWCLNVEV